MEPYSYITINYFSGTGNAKNVARWFADESKTKKIQFKINDIGKQEINNNKNSGDSVLTGFCYPTHGFNAPPIVLKYIWKYPRALNGESFFLINTRAGLKLSNIFIPGLSGLALLLPMIILLLKGYKLVGYRSIDLPSNWISLHPGLKPKVVHSIFKRCKRITKEYAIKILSGRKVMVGFWWLPMDLLLIPISIGYYFFGRFALSKTYLATSDCNNCNLCIEACPVSAIRTLDGYPYWTYTCESCMKCMNNCPKRAIETPHGFIAAVWWTASVLLPVFVYRLLSGLMTSEKIIYNLIYMALCLLFVFGTYRIAHFLMKYNWFNQIIRYTSLTHYRFWRRYKAPANLQ